MICLWGQCAHKSEPAAGAMAGKGGGISHKEQPLRGAQVNGVTARLCSTFLFPQAVPSPGTLLD